MQPYRELNLVFWIAVLIELERWISAIALTLKGPVDKEAVGQALEALSIYFPPCGRTAVRTRCFIGSAKPLSLKPKSLVLKACRAK
jgi:hypothetical protein